MVKSKSAGGREGEAQSSLEVVTSMSRILAAKEAEVEDMREVAMYFIGLFWKKRALEKREYSAKQT